MLTSVTDILTNANSYMLTSKNICNIEVINKPDFKPRIKHEEKPVIITKTAPNDIFFPKQTDKFFWCFYVILYNQSEYDMVSNYFTKETEIKYKWIEEFRNNKTLFKPIKVSKNVVETELAHNKMITMNSIKALCYLKNVNIFYIDNQKYYEIIVNETSPIYLIEKIEKNIGLKQNVTSEQIEYYRSHFWKLENLDKPLKAVSSYKVDELRDICKRLNIEADKSTKPQLYEKILNKLIN
jgi:hypothetical protein